jgi:hypothetical protein
VDIESFIKFTVIMFAVGLFTVSAYLYLQLERSQANVRGLNVLDMTERRTIQPIESLVRGTDALGGNTELVATLNDIATDMAYFEANGTLRRSIDWSYIWK